MIPDRYRAACEFCGLDVDVRDTGVFQHTSGWVMNRAGGGGHGVSLPERANRWGHRQCVERAVKGATHQQRMFS
jgi:hypothetical protein